MQVNSKAVANCERPKCDACEFGKGHRQPNKVNTTNKNPMKEQELKKDYLLPGQMVSVDHYISRAPGRLYHTKGKSDQSDMFSGGCVFIYHASGYVSIKHQVAINATETVKAKLTFEREAQSQGVVIKEYHTDDGIFNSSEFMEELLKKQKNIRFSGDGTSHQNGAAERAIKTVVTMERNMLMKFISSLAHDALPICVRETKVEPTWSPRYIMICRHHFSWQNIILLELFLIHRIILDFIYFIGLAMTLSKITGNIFGPFTVGHCLGISLHLQTPCTD